MTELAKPGRRNPGLKPKKVAPDAATAAAYDAAWEVEPPGGVQWTARPWVNPTARGTVSMPELAA